MTAQTFLLYGCLEVFNLLSLVFSSQVSKEHQWLRKETRAAFLAPFVLSSYGFIEKKKKHYYILIVFTVVNNKLPISKTNKYN